MSIRGARLSRHRPAKEVLLEPIEVQVAEGQMYLRTQLLSYCKAPLDNFSFIFWLCLTLINTCFNALRYVMAKKFLQHYYI